MGECQDQGYQLGGGHININIKTEENKLDYKYFWASDHLETKTESDIPETWLESQFKCLY